MFKNLASMWGVRGVVGQGTSPTRFIMAQVVRGGRTSGSTTGNGIVRDLMTKIRKVKLVRPGVQALKVVRPPLSVWMIGGATIGFGGYQLLRSSRFVLVAECSRILEPRMLLLDKDESVPFNWKFFWSLLKPHWFLFVIAIGSALIVAYISIEIPHVLGFIVDIITRHQFDELQDIMRPPVVRLVCLYVLQSIATFGYITSLSYIGEHIATDLRNRMFQSMMNQPIEFFDGQMTGEILNRLTADVQEFKSSFKQVMNQGLRAASQTIGCILSLWVIQPDMTKTMLIILPPIICAGTIFGSVLRKLSRRAQAQSARATIVADEAIGNIRTVRSFSMDDKEVEMYAAELAEAEKLSHQLAFGIGVFQAGSSFFLNSVVLAVLYVGGGLIASHDLTSGDLMSFLIGAQTIQKSLTTLSLLFGTVVKGMAAGSRVFEYIALDPGGKYGIIPEQEEGEVVFHNITFAYKDRDIVLKRFNLRLPPGKVVAVVGGSGEGKSTIVSLLQSFYKPSKGDITVDGNSVEDLDPRYLNGHLIGVIKQEPVLFATSVMENIRYGKPHATDEEVYEAARNANAYNFIHEFPNGFDTVIGERGVTVSGGQKQRIAIARALIKNPRILVLDEATSALDTESECLIQQTLDNAAKGRTVLVIAHRLTTIQNADLIAVLKEGAICEIGSHKELVEANGIYSRLVQQQELTK